MKVCKKCGAAKALQEFSKTIRQPDGLQARCKVCCAEYHAAWRIRNAEKLRAYFSAYYSTNRERVREGVAAYRKANIDKVNAYDALRRQANPGRCRESKRAWEKRNPEAMAAKEAKRRSAGQPPWIKKYKAEVKAIYAEASRKKLTVDHIVPLLGKTVCGLHVPWNLQMLTLKENSAKGNKLLGILGPFPTR